MLTVRHSLLHTLRVAVSSPPTTWTRLVAESVRIVSLLSLRGRIGLGFFMVLAQTAASVPNQIVMKRDLAGVTPARPGVTSGVFERGASTTSRAQRVLRHAMARRGHRGLRGRRRLRD